MFMKYWSQGTRLSMRPFLTYRLKPMDGTPMPVYGQRDQCLE